MVAALAFGAFYAAFAGALSVTEMLTMVVPVAAALVLTVAMHRVADRRFTLRAPWFWLLARTGTSIVRDSFKVGFFLLRSLWRDPYAPAGTTNSQPFRFGAESARQATRRALVTLSVSASPDQYVIEMSPDERIRSHSLVGGPIKSDREWPV